MSKGAVGSVTSPAEKISLANGTLIFTEDAEKKTLNMRLGENGTLEALLLPEYSTDLGAVKWSASGGVALKKGILYAKKITKDGRPAKVIVKCGKKKDTVYVTVTK